MYSPALAPGDYLLLPALNDQLNSKRLQGDNDMQTCVIQCCQFQDKDFDQGSKNWFCDVTVAHVLFLLVLEINRLEYMTSKLFIIAYPLHLVFLSCSQQVYKIMTTIK